MGAVFGIIAAALLIAWSSELLKAIRREKKQRELAIKQPWLKRRRLATQSIVSALMVLTQTSSVVYYTSGFGVSHSILCGQATVHWRIALDVAHALITAGNFCVVCKLCSS